MYGKFKFKCAKSDRFSEACLKSFINCQFNLFNLLIYKLWEITKKKTNTYGIKYLTSR